MYHYVVKFVFVFVKYYIKNDGGVSNEEKTIEQDDGSHLPITPAINKIEEN